MELDLPSHRRKIKLFRGIGGICDSARKKGEEGVPCKTEATQYHKLRVVDMRTFPRCLKHPAQESQTLTGSWQWGTKQWSGG